MVVDFKKALEQKKAQKEPIELPAKRPLWIGTVQMSRVSRSTRVHDENEWILEDVLTGTWYVDTTTKGKHPLFAPGWDIVLGHKAWVSAGSPIQDQPKPEYVKELENSPLPKGTLVDDALYEAVYLTRMQKSYRTYRDEWIKLLRDAYEGEHNLILICFCRNEAFCHRYQLKDMLLKVCAKQEIPVHDCGEWEV